MTDKMKELDLPTSSWKYNETVLSAPVKLSLIPQFKNEQKYSYQVSGYIYLKQEYKNVNCSGYSGGFS